MSFFFHHIRILLAVLVCCAALTTLTNQVAAQSLPAARSEVTFAGVSIYLSEAARLQVQQEIRLLYANRKQLEQDMNALRELTPLWQPLLQEARLPLDFRYVALPFSDTRSTAYWSVQAEQVSAAGLRVDQFVDETKHPLVATEKIIELLKQLRGRYQENAVRLLLRYLQNGRMIPIPAEALAKSSVESAWLDIDSPALLWKILARKIMVEQQEPTYRPAVTFVLYTYNAGSGQTLPAIARQLRVPEDRLQAYNHWLKTPVVPIEAPYPVLVQLTDDEFPAIWSAGLGSDRSGGVSSASRVDLGFPVLLKSSVRADGLRAPALFYTINEQRGIQAQPCDNAVTLAYYGGISPNDFLKYNDLTQQDVVRPGQIYYLERKAKRAKIPYHVVQRNESLRDVANIYGMRLSSLLRFNRIETTKRAGPGRILWLRQKRPRNRPVQNQQLQPEPGPVLSLPEPLLSSLNSSTTPGMADSSDSLTLSQSAGQQKPATGELKIGTPEPVAVPKPLETPKQATAPLPEPVVVIPSTPARVLPGSAVASKERDQTETTAAVHTVRSGQTYYAISQLYDTTPDQLYKWNGLSEKIPLEIGQELIVSASSRKPVPGRPATVTVLPGQSSKGIINKFTVEGLKPVVYHVVQPGQTVYRIALLNRTTVANVMKWNNLKDYTIEVGQKLIVRNPQ